MARYLHIETYDIGITKSKIHKHLKNGRYKLGEFLRMLPMLPGTPVARETLGFAVQEMKNGDTVNREIPWNAGGYEISIRCFSGGSKDPGDQTWLAGVKG